MCIPPEFQFPKTLPTKRPTNSSLVKKDPQTSASLDIADYFPFLRISLSPLSSLNPEDFRFCEESSQVRWYPKQVCCAPAHPACSACPAFGCGREKWGMFGTHTYTHTMRICVISAFVLIDGFLPLCHTRQTWCHAAFKDPGMLLPVTCGF